MTYQTRSTVSMNVNDTLLLKKIADKVDLSQSLIVSALIREEAKKRRVKVTVEEIEQFKEERRAGKPTKSEQQKRAEKLYPGAFK